MTKQTPRDLFNPPPQAPLFKVPVPDPVQMESRLLVALTSFDGHVTNGSYAALMRVLGFACGGIVENSKPYVIGENCSPSVVRCDCQSSPHHPQCVTLILQRS
jgi:hypothetical protein